MTAFSFYGRLDEFSKRNENDSDVGGEPKIVDVVEVIPGIQGERPLTNVAAREEQKTA